MVTLNNAQQKQYQIWGNKPSGQVNRIELKLILIALDSGHGKKYRIIEKDFNISKSAKENNSKWKRSFQILIGKSN